MLLSAVLFDVDGTMAETEDLHRRSFNESFKEFNLDWYWDEPIYRELINIGSGKERIEYYIKRAWPEMLDYKNLSKYIDSIHKVKNEIFEDFIMESEVKMRPGVMRLINELKEKEIRIAIVSSTSENNLITLFVVFDKCKNLYQLIPCLSVHVKIILSFLVSNKSYLFK